MGLGSCWACARRALANRKPMRTRAARMRNWRRSRGSRRVRGAGADAAGWSGEAMMHLERRLPLFVGAILIGASAIFEGG
jgi:hypothetical protein